MAWFSLFTLCLQVELFHLVYLTWPVSAQAIRRRCAIHCHLYRQSVGYEVGLVFEHQLTVLSHSRAELLADYRAGTSQFSMWSV
jgi:hypothetical protein